MHPQSTDRPLAQVACARQKTRSPVRAGRDACSGPEYKFAYSLTRAEADASDLTQQTFYLWATKGHQLRERSKVKTWLFTTLYRTFLDARKRQTRFPHCGLDEAAPEDLPAASPPSGLR